MGGGMWCLVMFNAKDVCELMKLDKEQKEANNALEACQIIIDHELEGWVPRLVFDINGLHRLALKSVDWNLAVIVKLVKLTKGRCDRTFLITMHEVARVYSAMLSS